MLLNMILSIVLSVFMQSINTIEVTNTIQSDTASVYILNDSASNNHYTLDFNCDYQNVMYVNVWLTIKKFQPATLNKDEVLIETILWDQNPANSNKEANCDDTPYFYESEEATEVLSVQFSTNKDSLDIPRKSFQKSWWMYLPIITDWLK